MKTWVWTLVAIVGGYLVYSAWFAPVEEDDSKSVTIETPPALEVSAGDEAPAAEPAKDAQPRRRIDFDIESGATEAVRNDESLQMAAAREEALRTGDTEKAGKLAETILESYPASDAARWIRYERGREYLRQYKATGKNKEGLPYAHRALQELTPVLFASDLRMSERKELRAQLGRLSRDVFFTRHIEGVDRVYMVKPGDTLGRLCVKVFPQWGTQASAGFVAAVNRLKGPEALRAREPIRVPLGKPEIIISKGDFRLYYLFNGCYVRDYPVGLGREGSTPEAAFVVEEKIRNPDWNPQPGMIIPYGDPRNILGTRWMAFRNSADYRGFGIHGTAEPSSIGKEASSGCVRMLRADVEELFDWTPRRTRVVIVR